MILRLLCLVILLIWQLQSFAVERIEAFHSEIEIQADGDLLVTETIVVNAEGKEIRRGIYRDFPTRYRSRLGFETSVGFEVLSVLRDGKPEFFHLQKQANGTRVYIGNAGVLLEPGLYEYRLAYRTTRQLGFFDDFDELYWNVTGNGWIFEITRASARVVLPAPVDSFELTGYTGPQGATRQDLVHRREDERRVYFETTRPLPPHNGLTIVAGWPKGIVAEPAAAQKRQRYIADNKAALMIVAGVFVLLVYYLWQWFRLGRDPARGVIIPRYKPPAGYTPAAMRYVRNMGYDKKCFTAAIINLAVKGDLTIESLNDEFEVKKTDAETGKLAAGELQIMSTLFGSGRDQLSIDQDNHEILSRAISRHEAALERNYNMIYFNSNSALLTPAILTSIVWIVYSAMQLPDEAYIAKTIAAVTVILIPLVLVAMAVKGLMTGKASGKRRAIISAAVLLGLVMFYFGTNVPIHEFVSDAPPPVVVGIILILVVHSVFYDLLKAPTLAGRRLLDQVEGFRHYLDIAEQDKIASLEAPEMTSDIYEAYLPYAIALDLENEWTSKLNVAMATGSIDRDYRQPDWYHSRDHDTTHFSEKLAVSFDSAISSASVAPGTSSGSSGGSSGGGSSGGGGGGGGGGGW